jgi:hypothetical protein
MVLSKWKSVGAPAARPHDPDQTAGTDVDNLVAVGREGG